MPAINIHVTQIASGSWGVSDGALQSPKSLKRMFKIRGHAIAFGRALALASGSGLYIHGPDGIGVLQTKASLSYPVTLQ